MPFDSNSAAAAGRKSKPNGIRKDAISHGLYASVMAVGGFPAYFSKLYKLAPTKHADLIAKYIPAEIEQKVSGEVQHVLQVNLAKSRELPTSPQAIDIPCEVIEHDTLTANNDNHYYNEDAQEQPTINEHDTEQVET